LYTNIGIVAVSRDCFPESLSVTRREALIKAYITEYPVGTAEECAGNKKPEILSKLAQYELTLKDWIRDHKGYRKYVTIAGKCWPAFQTQFGFVPCYVNSRLAAQGIPVSCEVDINNY